MIMRRLARSLALAAAVAVCGGLAAQAQTYPTKPIKIVIGYGAGGVADVMARLVGQKMSASMGQQVIVDNKPGAGQIVAAQAVAKADPDGYTLLFLNTGNVISASLFKSLPYDTEKDFVPISPVGFFGIMILTGKDSPITSLRDLIQQAKANPGKLNIGATSVGSTQNLSAELFKTMAGIDVSIVPYKSTPDLITAVGRNDLQAMFESPVTTLNLIRDGQLRPLALTSAHRFAGLPDVPTVTEAGVPGYEVTTWNAIAAPARTPPAIIERLHKEILAALAQRDIQERFGEFGIEARGGTPADTQALVANEIVKWRDVIKAAKIEPQ
jgi:tripartite-type tricarboxylate transporter receptor subunit TctC